MSILKAKPIYIDENRTGKRLSNMYWDRYPVWVREEEMIKWAMIETDKAIYRNTLIYMHHGVEIFREVNQTQGNEVIPFHIPKGYHLKNPKWKPKNGKNIIEVLKDQVKITIRFQHKNWKEDYIYEIYKDDGAMVTFDDVKKYTLPKDYFISDKYLWSGDFKAVKEQTILIPCKKIITAGDIDISKVKKTVTITFLGPNNEVIHTTKLVVPYTVQDYKYEIPYRYDKVQEDKTSMTKVTVRIKPKKVPITLRFVRKGDILLKEIVRTFDFGTTVDFNTLMNEVVSEISYSIQGYKCNVIPTPFPTTEQSWKIDNIHGVIKTVRCTLSLTMEKIQDNASIPWTPLDPESVTYEHEIEYWHIGKMIHRYTFTTKGSEVPVLSQVPDGYHIVGNPTLKQAGKDIIQVQKDGPYEFQIEFHRRVPKGSSLKSQYTEIIPIPYQETGVILPSLQIKKTVADFLTGSKKHILEEYWEKDPVWNAIPTVKRTFELNQSETGEIVDVNYLDKNIIRIQVNELYQAVPLSQDKMTKKVTITYWDTTYEKPTIFKRVTETYPYKSTDYKLDIPEGFYKTEVIHNNNLETSVHMKRYQYTVHIEIQDSKGNSYDQYTLKRYYGEKITTKDIHALPKDKKFQEKYPITFEWKPESFPFTDKIITNHEKMVLQVVVTIQFQPIEEAKGKFDKLIHSEELYDLGVYGYDLPLAMGYLTKEEMTKDIEEATIANIGYLLPDTTEYFGIFPFDPREKKIYIEHGFNIDGEPITKLTRYNLSTNKAKSVDLDLKTGSNEYIGSWDQTIVKFPWLQNNIDDRKTDHILKERRGFFKIDYQTDGPRSYFYWFNHKKGLPTQLSSQSSNDRIIQTFDKERPLHWIIISDKLACPVNLDYMNSEEFRRLQKDPLVKDSDTKPVPIEHLERNYLIYCTSNLHPYFDFYQNEFGSGKRNYRLPQYFWGSYPGNKKDSTMFLWIHTRLALPLQIGKSMFHFLDRFQPFVTQKENDPAMNLKRKDTTISNKANAMPIETIACFLQDQMVGDKIPQSILEKCIYYYHILYAEPDDYNQQNKSIRYEYFKPREASKGKFISAFDHDKWLTINPIADILKNAETNPLGHPDDETSLYIVGGWKSFNRSIEILTGQLPKLIRSNYNINKRIYEHYRVNTLIDYFLDIHLDLIPFQTMNVTCKKDGAFRDFILYGEYAEPIEYGQEYKPFRIQTFETLNKIYWQIRYRPFIIPRPFIFHHYKDWTYKGKESRLSLLSSTQQNQPNAFYGYMLGNYDCKFVKGWIPSSGEQRKINETLENQIRSLVTVEDCLFYYLLFNKQKGIQREKDYENNTDSSNEIYEMSLRNGCIIKALVYDLDIRTLPIPSTLDFTQDNKSEHEHVRTAVFNIVDKLVLSNMQDSTKESLKKELMENGWLRWSKFAQNHYQPYPRYHTIQTIGVVGHEASIKFEENMDKIIREKIGDRVQIIIIDNIVEIQNHIALSYKHHISEMGGHEDQGSKFKECADRLLGLLKKYNHTYIINDRENLASEFHDIKSRKEIINELQNAIQNMNQFL